MNYKPLLHQKNSSLRTIKLVHANCTPMDSSRQSLSKRTLLQPLVFGVTNCSMCDNRFKIAIPSGKSDKSALITLITGSAEVTPSSIREYLDKVAINSDSDEAMD